MMWNHFFISIFLVTLLWNQALCDDDDEEEEEQCACILLAIMEDARECEGWDAPPIQVDLHMDFKKGEEDMPDMVQLAGTINSSYAIDDGIQINIKVLLITPEGNEPCMQCGADICNSIQDKDAPWASLMAAFNTSECPIPKNLYPVSGMALSLDFAQGALTREFCGKYVIQLTIEKGLDKIMCFELGAEIFEEQRPCSECASPADDKRRRK